MSDRIVGIDIGGTKLLLASEGTVERHDTGTSFGPQEIADAIRAFVGGLDGSCAALGIAVPGLVEDGDHVVACDVLPRLTGWRASRGLATMGVRTVVVNDVQAALAEAFHDAPTGTTAGIVMAGTAVGAAFLVEGRPLRGASGFAGELGYLPMRRDGNVMRLDDLAGGRFMAERLGIDGARLAASAERRDTAALAVIREGGEALGTALAAIVNLFNPARLAVGGGALSLPGYWEAAQAALERCSIPLLLRDCRIQRVDHRPDLVARGAARCAARNS